MRWRTSANARRERVSDWVAAMLKLQEAKIMWIWGTDNSLCYLYRSSDVAGVYNWCCDWWSSIVCQYRRARWNGWRACLPVSLLLAILYSIDYMHTHTHTRFKGHFSGHHGLASCPIVSVFSHPYPVHPHETDWNFSCLYDTYGMGGFQDSYLGLLFLVRHGFGLPFHWLSSVVWRRSSSAGFCRLKDLCCQAYL